MSTLSDNILDSDELLQDLLNTMRRNWLQASGFAATRVRSSSPHGPEDTVILERPGGARTKD